MCPRRHAWQVFYKIAICLASELRMSLLTAATVRLTFGEKNPETAMSGPRGSAVASMIRGVRWRLFSTLVWTSHL